MTREALEKAVTEAKVEAKNALQTMYDALNHGQQKQILKDEKVKAYFGRYGVEYE